MERDNFQTSPDVETEKTEEVKVDEPALQTETRLTGTEEKSTKARREKSIFLEDGTREEFEVIEAHTDYIEGRKDFQAKFCELERIKGKYRFSKFTVDRRWIQKPALSLVRILFTTLHPTFVKRPKATVVVIHGFSEHHGRHLRVTPHHSP